MIPVAAKKRIVIHSSLAQERTTPLTARGDRDRLEQVLTNLLSNAIRFTQEDGRIEVELKRREKEFEVLVKDNGIGIPAKDLPHVFERFYRVKSRGIVKKVAWGSDCRLSGNRGTSMEDKLRSRAKRE